MNVYRVTSSHGLGGGSKRESLGDSENRNGMLLLRTGTLEVRKHRLENTPKNFKNGVLLSDVHATTGSGTLVFGCWLDFLRRLSECAGLQLPKQALITATHCIDLLESRHLAYPPHGFIIDFLT